jgi:hypothetical protein
MDKPVLGHFRIARSSIPVYHYQYRFVVAVVASTLLRGELFGERIVST